MASIINCRATGWMVINPRKGAVLEKEGID
jgi:hypothetical protein